MTFALPEADKLRDPSSALSAAFKPDIIGMHAWLSPPPAMTDMIAQTHRLQLALFDQWLRLWLLPISTVHDKCEAEDEAITPAEQSVDSAAAATMDGGGEPVAAPAVLIDKPDGAPDDLERIVGIGPKLKQTLNALGIWHFRQIAALSSSDVTWLNEKIGFSGRIEREGWQAQASRLAKAPRPPQAA